MNLRAPGFFKPYVVDKPKIYITATNVIVLFTLYKESDIAEFSNLPDAQTFAVDVYRKEILLQGEPDPGKDMDKDQFITIMLIPKYCSSPAPDPMHARMTLGK